MTDFEIFKKTFTKYQEEFGLTGYQIYFEHKSLKVSAFAQIIADQRNAAATVILNSKLLPENIPFKNVKRSAKHEAIHLLLERLEHLARCRYIGEEEIYEAVEELVVKLEKLIPDVR